jgi:uncharacterized protein
MSMAMSSTRLGFGVDWQYRRRYPEGLSSLCEYFRSRLSHISCVSLSSVKEATEFVTTCSRGLPTIHHLPGVAPAAPDGPDLELLLGLEAVSNALQAAWTCEDIGLWSVGPYPLPYFTPPLFEPDVAQHIARGIRRLMSTSSYPFLAEIPSCTFVAGRMALGEFFWLITEGANCDLVLDVAHVYSYALATGRRYEQVLASLPLDRVLEIHVAGGYVEVQHESRYLDTHSHNVVPEVLELLVQAVEECPRLRAITYEIGVGLDRDNIERNLDRLESTMEAMTWTPSIGGIPA